MEIERKFIIQKEIDLSSFNYDDIVQGYVSLDPEIRVRAKGGKYFKTSKSAGDMVREEREIEISFGEYTSLMENCTSRTVSKRRYYIPYGRYTVEVDVFKNRHEGLVVAEVEFSTVEDAELFIPPEWFGLEVTNDSRFKNKNLSTAGSVPNLKEQK